MPRRRKSSTIEDWIDLVSMLPWWIGVVSALVSYVLLSRAADRTPDAVTGVNQLGGYAIQVVLQTAAYFGQFLVPMVCLVGAIGAAIRQNKAKRSDDEKSTFGFTVDRQERKLAPEVRWTKSSWIEGESDGPRGIDQQGYMYGQGGVSAASTKEKSGIDIDRLLTDIEWRRFEALVERWYQLQGFSTRAQPHGPDGGVDIKLYCDLDGSGELEAVVQCKHWGTRYVGVESVRALRGSMVDLDVNRGFLVTSSSFTNDAIEFATKNQIGLVNRRSLIDGILKLTKDEREGIVKLAMQGKFDTPTCASCGIKMIKRRPRKGGDFFWGCVNYPRCKSVIRIGRQK